MNRPNRGWYVLIGLLALAPLAVRAITWLPRSRPVDAQAAQAGQVLFNHEWVPHDPLANGGDGLGPVFNANSCVACHHQGGVGGSGGLENNVTAFVVAPKDGPPREGVVHADGIDGRETLAQVHPDLPEVSRPTLAMLVPIPGSADKALSFPAGVHISQRNTPALFGAKLIDDLPDRVIIAAERTERLRWGGASPGSDHLPVGRALRLAGGRVGKFGWKAQSPSLAEFVQAACANELGLGNPGQAQPRPLGRPEYESPGLDLTQEQCDQLTEFVASLGRPLERLPGDPSLQEEARRGKALFTRIGCAECHTPDLGPIEGIYSDLLLHRMGQPLQGGGSYGSMPQAVPDLSPGDGGPAMSEWRTPPLWGVADSAPYLHDGRAATLKQAIEFHGGQAARAATTFAALPEPGKRQLVAFLKTLRAP